MLLGLAVMLVTLVATVRPAQASCTCADWTAICQTNSSPCPADAGTPDDAGTADPQCGMRCCDICSASADSPRPGENLCGDYCAAEPTDDDGSGSGDDGCRIAPAASDASTATGRSWPAPAAASLLGVALILAARRQRRR
jgi:hypothetical protein